MKLLALMYAVFFLLFSAVFVLSPSSPTLAAEGVFLADNHKSRGMDCSGCHGKSPPKQDVPMVICLGCHGDYQKVVAKTDKLDPNPHNSHLGEVDCGKCHRAHKASVIACNECHQFDMQVP